MLAVVIIATFIYLFRFCWSSVFGSPDTCWILAAGRYIVEHHALPRHDIFSWTMPQQPWILYQWFFEEITAGILKLGGLWLVGLTAYVSMGVLLGYALPRWWLNKGVPSWVTFTASILGLNLVWFYVRPQLASFFLIPIFLAILEKKRLQPESRAIWLLPVLMMLWANLHAWWFIGLLAILCYDIFVKWPDGRWIGSVLVLSTLAVLVNPYGWGIVQYDLSFLREADFSGLAELRSPFQFNSVEMYMFLLYCLAAWTILISKFRRLPMAGLVFGAIGTIAALMMARFMPVAILATWPYVGLALSEFDWKDKYTVFAKQPLWKWIHPAAAIAIPLTVWMVLVPNEQTALNALTYQRADGFRFIAEHRAPDERLYNDEQTGAQMLFLQMGPVFIDNRFDMYGKKFCDEWLVASHALPGWQEYLKKYGINTIVLERKQDLVPRLMQDPNWLLAYSDPYLTYWVLNTPENVKLLNAWHVSPGTVAQSSLPSVTRDVMLRDLYFKHLTQGLAFQKENHLEKAADEFRDALAVASPADAADAHHNLIHALAVEGNRRELADALRQARPFFWKFDGEAHHPIAHFDAQQQERIDKWVIESTDQLMKKYHP